MTAPILLRAGDPGLAAHAAVFGSRPSPSLDGLLGELEAAGLDGRGGAGFPVHRKLAAVARASARGGAPIVVGNGSEGEPLSAKDRVLLQRAPHLVLDGLLICAEALGSDEAHLVVHADARSVAERALAERSDAGIVRLHVADHGFVGGEASALVAGVSGRPGVPSDRIVRLAERGLRRRPTLVQNVESLAQVAVIARTGADRHRSRGRAGDAGTRLVSVSTPGETPIVLEVDGGTAIAEILTATGVTRDPAAALVGGFHGTWLPRAALDAALSPRGLAEWGASPGSGVLHVLSGGDCGIRATADMLAFLAAASARQCGPCLNGLPAIAGSMRALAAGRDTRDELRRLAGLVDGRGACAHPDGTVRLLRSALTVFADDAQAHTEGRCRAGRRVRS